MNRRRIGALERAFQVADDEPTLQVQVDEFRRLYAWLAEQGFADDPHRAIAAGLHTPAQFRFCSLQDLVRAQEDLAVFHWFLAWRHMIQKRKRLADPTFAFAREHDSEVLDHLTKEAAQCRAKLDSWGYELEDALNLARQLEVERSEGNTMPADEFDRIAAAIRDAEGQRVKQEV
jgi:hypothetical protein